MKITLTSVSKRLKAFSSIVLLRRSFSKTCFTSCSKRIFEHCYYLYEHPS